MGWMEKIGLITGILIRSFARMDTDSQKKIQSDQYENQQVVLDVHAENVPTKVVAEEDDKKKSQINTNKDGHLIAKSAEDYWRIATMAVKSGFLPKGYTKPEQVVIALQYCVGLGLAPTIPALNNIAVINGSPSIFGDLPLQLVRESGKLKYFDEYLITKEYERISLENKNLNAKPWAAVCEVQREDYIKKQITWTVDQQAQTGNKNPVWSKYFTIMLKRKARSIALKDEFPDVLGAVPIAEYTHETMPEMRDVGNKIENPADKFNKMFGDENGSGSTSKPDN